MFPIWKILDRIVISEPGVTPPPLGVEMFPDTGDKQKLNSMKPYPIFDTNHIYSFSFHSMYVDLVNWRVINLPGVDEVELRSIWKDLPIHFVSYDLKEGHELNLHRDVDKRYLFSFSVQNTGGPVSWVPTPIDSPKEIQEKQEIVQLPDFQHEKKEKEQKKKNQKNSSKMVKLWKKCKAKISSPNK